MSNFKRVKNLTLDVLKFVEMEPRHVKITGPMHLGKEQKSSRDGASSSKREPAMLAPCINLEDGTECQIILSAVVKSTLNDEYPNESYVGKCFEIAKKPKVPGKEYFPYSVVEIEDPSTPVAIETAKTEPAKHSGGKRA